MDKSQKQLVDTYIRKRAIASKENRAYEFLPYEIDHIVKNRDNFDLNTFKFSDNKKFDYIIKHPEEADQIDYNTYDPDMGYGNYMEKLLIYIPSSVVHFRKRDLQNLGNGLTTEVLIARPELFDYLNTSKLSSDNIVNLIVKRPALAKNFDLKLLKPDDIDDLITAKPEFIDDVNIDNIPPFGISLIIGRRPELINRFDTSKLNGRHISQAISINSDLANYFKDRLSELDERDIHDILIFKKDLFPLFKKWIPLLDDEHTRDLIFRHPELIDKYNWNMNHLSINVINRLLGQNPFLKDSPKINARIKELNK